MAAEQRRRLRVLLSAVLLGGGVLLALSLDEGQLSQQAPEYSATLFDAAQFSLRFRHYQLHMAGTTASSDHEAALLKLARDQFGDADITTEFKAAVGVAPEWETLSARLLYLLAATQSADASLTADGITVRGISSDGAAYEKRQHFLQSALRAGQQLDADVIVLRRSPPLATLCRRNFLSFAHEPIRFRQSSSSIRPSSHALLDKLAEFLFDCSAARVAIVGHTDATGSAARNVEISRVRAEAVAAALLQRGVQRERLIVEGRGAAQPVADNNTVHGREQNRRIELELR